MSTLIENVNNRNITEQLIKTRMGSVEESMACTHCSTWLAVCWLFWRLKYK